MLSTEFGASERITSRQSPESSRTLPSKKSRLSVTPHLFVFSCRNGVVGTGGVWHALSRPAFSDTIPRTLTAKRKLRCQTILPAECSRCDARDDLDHESCASHPKSSSADA